MEKKTKVKAGIVFGTTAVVGALLIGLCNRKPTTKMRVVSWKPVNGVDGLFMRPCDTQFYKPSKSFM